MYPTKRDTYMVTLIIINLGNIKQYMCLPEHTRALIIFCFSSRFTIHTTRLKIIYDPCQDEKSVSNIIRVLSSITNEIYTTRHLHASCFKRMHEYSDLSKPVCSSWL